MGWASADEIFDPVARVLIDCNADREMRVYALTVLINKLRDGDWDTWDYSYDQLRHDPAAVEAFHRAGCAPLDGADLTWSPSEHGGRWVLECDEHGDLGLDSGADGHDRLIRAWFAHLAELHDSDGHVDERLLIDQAPT